MTRRLVPIADGAVDLIETGAGDRTIILVHGTASSPRAMGRLAGLLPPGGFRVMAPAMIGYGDSVMAGDDGAVARNARLLLGLRASLRGEVTAIGHSMGGLVVLRALRAGLIVDRVALYEPVAFGVLDRSDPIQRAARAWDAGVVADMTAAITDGDAEAGVRGFIEAWNGQDWADMPAPVRAALVASAQVLLADVTAISADQTDAVGYRGIMVESLIMSGTASPPTARMVCDVLAAALPQGRHLTIAGVGHMAPVQHPDLVAATVLEFLGG